MIEDLLDAIVSWRTLLAVLLVYGFAPGALLRLIVLAFRRDDPRRSEMLAELHAVPFAERPFWVFEQLEVALFEGIWGRVIGAATRRRKERESSILALRAFELGYRARLRGFVEDQLNALGGVEALRNAHKSLGMTTGLACAASLRTSSSVSTPPPHSRPDLSSGDYKTT